MAGVVTEFRPPTLTNARASSILVWRDAYETYLRQVNGIYHARDATA